MKPYNQPGQHMPMNQPMGNPTQVMNQMTSMQNVQKKYYEMYLFYCDTNNLNSFDPNGMRNFSIFSLQIIKLTIIILKEIMEIKWAYKMEHLMEEITSVIK